MTQVIFIQSFLLTTIIILLIVALINLRAMNKYLYRKHPKVFSSLKRKTSSSVNSGFKLIEYSNFLVTPYKDKDKKLRGYKYRNLILFIIAAILLIIVGML